MQFELSEHASDVIVERKIDLAWVALALEHPDEKILGEDGNRHYFRRVEAFGGRILHVVTNPSVSPERVITVFFDRRARRQSETKS